MHTLPGDSSLAKEPVHRSNITTESLFLISLRNPRGGKKREEGKSVAVAAVRLENKSLISGNHFISYANGKILVGVCIIALYIVIQVAKSQQKVFYLVLI